MDCFCTRRCFNIPGGALHKAERDQVACDTGYLISVTDSSFYALCRVIQVYSDDARDGVCAVHMLSKTFNCSETIAVQT